MSSAPRSRSGLSLHLPSIEKTNSCDGSLGFFYSSPSVWSLLGAYTTFAERGRLAKAVASSEAARHRHLPLAAPGRVTRLRRFDDAAASAQI